MYNRGPIRTFWGKTKRLESLGFPDELFAPPGRQVYWADFEFLRALSINEGVRAFAFIRPTLKDKCFFAATGTIYIQKPDGRLDGTLSEAYSWTWVRFKFPNSLYEGTGLYPGLSNVGFYNGSVMPLDHESLSLATETIRTIGDIGRRYLTTNWASPIYALSGNE